MEIRHGTSDKTQHKKERTNAQGNVHLEPLNGQVNTVARFEVARLNRNQQFYNRVSMEYIDNNAYDITECLESHYDMWDCCFMHFFSYGKQTHDWRATGKSISQDACNALLQTSWGRERVDLWYAAPRERRGSNFFF